MLHYKLTRDLHNVIYLAHAMYDVDLLTEVILFFSHNDTGEVSMFIESEVPNRPGVYRAASKAGKI